MKVWLALLISWMLLMSTNCVPTRVVYEPFKTGREEFFAKVKVIALAPVSVPEGLENAEKVKTKYEELIARTLHERGFTVVLSGEFDKVYKKTIEQMGGVYDPMTGKFDNVKGNAVGSHVFRELQRVVHSDAVLIPKVVVLSVRHFNGLAKWDGVTESIGGGQISGALDWFWATSRYGGVSGSMNALSLVVIIDDMNAVTMYANAGGIQLLGRYSGIEFEPIPQAEILSSEDRYQISTELALGALVNKTQPARDTKADSKK
ncbi:MAG: hypothetical protein AB7F94_12380 [Nitrospira sp.]